MSAAARHRGSRLGDQGQVLPLVALVMVVLMIAIAMAVDLSKLTNQKQELHDTLDFAAHAGAAELPATGTTAEAKALAVAAAADSEVVPTIDFWCIVGSTLSSGTYVVNTTHIPATCNPGPGPYVNLGAYAGLTCNETICAIPCVPSAGDLCNTIRVADSKIVPYEFAPVMDVDNGDTGTLVSVACKGSCGNAQPRQIDFAFVADRTGSMSTSDRDQVEAAIKSVLAELNPALHRAAFGVIGRRSTSAPATCRSQPASSASGSTNATPPWMAVGLTSSFGNTGELWRAVDCLTSSGTGTHLAAPFNAARNVLVSTGRSTATKAIVFMTDGEPNEVNSGGGAYSESIGDDDGTTACNNASTASNGAGGAKAAGLTVITIAFRLEGTRCAAGLDTDLTFNLSGCTSAGSGTTKTCTVTGSNGTGTYSWAGQVTGTGNSKTFTAQRNRSYSVSVTANGTTATRTITCNNSTNWSCSAGSVTRAGGGSHVVDVLAGMASDHPNGGASTANNANGGAPCSDTTEADAENADGDFFFCTADAADLRYIYETAVAAVNTGVRFIKFPS